MNLTRNQSHKNTISSKDDPEDEAMATAQLDKVPKQGCSQTANLTLPIGSPDIRHRATIGAFRQESGKAKTFPME